MLHCQFPSKCRTRVRWSFDKEEDILTLFKPIFKLRELLHLDFDCLKESFNHTHKVTHNDDTVVDKVLVQLQRSVLLGPTSS